MAEQAPSETADRNTPALACSGGGFRATLFHCGALTRLNELGVLTRLGRISSVSGGSIATGMLAAAWPRLAIRNGAVTNLHAEVIEPLRRFCRRSIDGPSVIWGAALPGKSIGDVLADAYDELFGGAMLQDLPEKPQFTFNATNLQTGRLVRMMKGRLADYTIGEILDPDISLGVAVAASSAFPPVLSPVAIRVDPERWRFRKGAFHFGDPAYNRRLALTDGGVYDNIGLETVDGFDPVIVSDAGAPFNIEPQVQPLWLDQALRALDVATDQARSLRKRLLVAETRAQGRTYVYSGIDGNPAEYPAPQRLKADLAVTGRLARLRTRLHKFSEEEQARLVNWGWLMMDVALRSYAVKRAEPPTTLPFPDFPLA